MILLAFIAQLRHPRNNIIDTINIISIANINNHITIANTIANIANHIANIEHIAHNIANIAQLRHPRNDIHNIIRFYCTVKTI